MLFSNAIIKGVGRHPKTNKIKMNNGGLYRKEIITSSVFQKIGVAITMFRGQ